MLYTFSFHDEHVDEFTCEECPSDSFCVDNARNYCPPNSTAIAFADSLEDCICNPGYNRNTEFEHQVCVVGKPPYYYYEGIQYVCPAHGDASKVTVNELSYRIEDCVCTPGYAGVAGSTDACNICAVNFYNEIYNATACLECSSNSQNRITASKSVYDCKCEPGYDGKDGGACTACPAGKFKSIFGNSSCETCPENTFSHTASTSCSQCHGNSTSEAESVSINDCLCNAGFSGVDGGPCVLCAVGKFKDAIANEACVDCADNTFSEIEGATSCVSCLANSAHGVERDRCLCNAGYTQADTVDTRPDCTPCAVNTYQPGSGETSCFECDANANGPEASTTPLTCFCNAGFYDPSDDTCDSCAAGTYKEAAVSAETDEFPCVLCPVNSHSPMQSVVITDCICNAGFDGPDGGACTACLAGKFKAANGSAACAECAFDFFSDTSASTECDSCVEFLNSSGAKTFAKASDSSDDCVCDLSIGYVEIRDLNDARTCTGCQAGTFATDEGCANCTNGQFSDVAGLSACKDCPASSSSYDYPHVGCQCDKGFRGVPNELVYNFNQSYDLTSLRNYANSIGGTVEATHYQTPIAQARYAWTLNGGFYSSNYNKGYFEMTLPAGYDTFKVSYSNIWGDGAPASGTPISIKINGDQVDSVYRLESKTYSQAYMPGDIFRIEEVNAIIGGDLKISFSSAEDVSCIACAEAKYKDYTGNDLSCSACQENSVSEVASVSQDDCECAFGYRQDGPDTCVACLAGHYADTLDSATCTACADRSYTQQSDFPWASIAKCTQCPVCGAATYLDHYDAANQGLGCGNGTATDCQACPEHKSLLDAFTFDNWQAGAESCKCDPGYEPVDSNIPSTCQTCDLDFFKSSVGDVACTQCQSTMVTEFEGTTDELGCVCPSGYYFDEIDGNSCVICAADTYKSGLSRQAVCDACKNHSTSEAGSDNQTDCLCVAGYQSVNDICEICAAGYQKESIANKACTECAVNTFAANLGTHTCESCAAGKSTILLTGQSYCECDAGTERESSDVLSDCQNCAEGKFKPAPSYDEPSCQNCSRCGAGQQVDTVCDRFQDITCKPCQDNSWSYAGRTELEPCFCNAGYELIGEACVACTIGKARTTNMHNSIACETCQDGKFVDTEAATECEFCASHCNGTIGLGNSSTNTYVSDECEATRDTVCAACTSCPPGQYAIQSCGIPFNNDRNDTKCALCPAGFYCPGGTDNNGGDIKPELCPDLSTSPAGSDSILDCQCAPGYFHNGELCQLCVLDTYCPGSNVVIECPSAGFTHQIGSSHRLDCHCLPGHFRNPPQDSENFNCSICTPNDWCFNNSLYDCPDIRMISNSGSKSFKNCTCMDGFYNNGLKCEECPLDHFCIDGNVFECDPMEWTNHLKRQSKCFCRPKFFRLEEICTVCTEDFYCDGTDDLRKACPPNSISSANSSTSQDCLCVPGFEHIHTNNHTLTHTCVECLTGKFKDSYGMYLCNPCRRCLAIKNVYELQSCTTTRDTRCDSCETCHKSHPAEDPRFVEVPCDDHQNSICAACTVCNFTNEYEKVPCTPETGNTICNNIIKTADECATGQFRGLHTAYSQSVCSACQYRDTKYYGMTLHVPSGTGREYNNQYSCPVRCLGNSILRNPSDMSLGCKSCEAGNVLLRNIQVVTDPSGNKVNCSFTCRNGYEYDPVRDDCYITILQHSQSNFFYHTLEVGDFHNIINGFSMRVVHSNHGKFMVVVGPSEPLDCKKHFCCQSHMWRISTLEQAGLTTGLHADSCSQSNELTSVKVDENTIDFQISDSKLNDVARCLNYENGTTTCVFTVSIIDLILRKSLSREVVIQTKRSVQYTFTNNPQKFIPLNFLQADILFLYNHSDLAYFQMTLQLRADTNMKIWTRVSSLDQMHRNMLQPCSRLSTSHDSIFQNVSQPVHVLEGETVTIISYWYGNTNQFYENDIPFAHFLAYLTLQIGGDDSRNIMDVGVSRKLSLLNSLCHTPLHTTTLALGHVLYTAGLGSDLVKYVFNENTDFTQARGEIGTMFTFLAYSELPEVETISLERAMAVHLSKPNIITPTELKKAVNTSDVVHFDLSASFRTTCRSKKPHCAYGYFNNHFNTNPIFIMNNCSDSNKNLARKWILSEMGATSDHNHINSICQLMESLKPHSTKTFFINSMSFIDKTNPIWNTFQNWTSPGTSTNIWAKFKFQV